MKRYFVAANLWLLVALGLLLAGQANQADKIIVLSHSEFSTAAYYLLVALCAVVAGACFAAHGQTKK